MKTKLAGMLAVCGGLLLAVAPARANLTTYGDLASWTSAVGTITTVDIPDVPDYPFFTYIGSGDASVTYSGVTFSQSGALSDGRFYNIGTDYYGINPPVLSSQEQNFGVANTLITLPSATRGIAIDYSTFSGSDVSFLFSNGDTFTQGSSAGVYYDTLDFAGVTDTPFTSVLVTSTDSVLNVGNIAYASTTTPEPGFYGLLTLGLAGLVCLGRRRRSA